MDTRVNLPPSSRAARLLRLADFIENAGYHFDMECWCDCMAGQCARMLGEPQMDIRQSVRQYLLLTYDESRTLFAPSGAETGVIGPLGRISRKWAVNTLRYFAMIGKLDWQAARTGEDDLRRPRRSEDFGYFEPIGDIILTLAAFDGPIFRDPLLHPADFRESRERSREPEAA